MWNLGEYRKRPQRLCDYLPWASFIAPGVVLNKDGSFQRTIRFRGPDLDSSSPHELVSVRARLNNVLRRFSSHWCLHLEAARRQALAYPVSSFPDALAQRVDDTRRETFCSESVHFESQYLPHDHLSAPFGRNESAYGLVSGKTDSKRTQGRLLRPLPGFFPRPTRADGQSARRLHAGSRAAR